MDEAWVKSGGERYCLYVFGRRVGRGEKVGAYSRSSDRSLSSSGNREGLAGNHKGLAGSMR
jgi:hypothetical protein